ncbi:hypothetical protein BCV69DRAFT_281112 [Microstroma glucosiphilum]|uniref:Zn(2)-C6 fungal-type domain-containing protein n=1 Tax=Pseudomicrostroma glucosiphilum TaxID=1684307 RepID=A0A316UAC0_9BASI|nr:hypothetical protein BCV69DRAFT_281112 [Pseudomicrostroma glucosiphilum]PWN22109.1 hypothetical protein BCV69DRAFT_281112 [Pseudomicrostroma glucosiphilum]
MPPAETDLRRWTRLNQGQTRGYPGIASPAADHSAPAKVACLECRRIKIRCLLPASEHHGSPDAGPSDLSQDGVCVRCARLGLECRRRPHRKGQRNSRQSEIRAEPAAIVVDPPALEAEPRKVAPGVSAIDRVAGQSEGSMSPRQPALSGSPHSGLESHDQTEWSHNSFSIQSLLGDEARTASGIRKTPYSVGGVALTKEALSPSDGMASQDGRSVSHIETPRVAMTGVVTVVEEGLFTLQQARYLHGFFFERLNGIIALLTPQLNSFETLSQQAWPQMLLTAICTVSAKYEFPDKYKRSLNFSQSLTSKIIEGEMRPTLSNCHALSILAMWRPPHDPSGWRKLHAACTLAFELGLHHSTQQLVQPGDPQRAEIIQRQRTYYHLACFEEFFVNQRRLIPLINWDVFPDPRVWVDSLSDDCLDVDVRIATAMDSISICRRLSEALQVERSKLPKGRALKLREVRLIRLAIHEQDIAIDTWLHSQERGIPAPFAMRPCGVFDNLNYHFCYWSSIWVIFCQSEMRSPHFDEDRRSSFAQASSYAIQLIEMFSGPYGQGEYYRFVHDHVICSAAAAACWIIDNWSAMPREDAHRSHQALRQAKDATSASQHRQNEQSSYLYAFLNFCCKKLPEQHILDDTSPVDVGALEVSQNLEWLLGSDERQRDFTMPYNWTFRSRQNSPPQAIPHTALFNSGGSSIDAPSFVEANQTGNGASHRRQSSHLRGGGDQGRQTNDGTDGTILHTMQGDSDDGGVATEQEIDESLASFLQRLLPDTHGSIMNSLYQNM